MGFVQLQLLPECLGLYPNRANEIPCWHDLAERMASAGQGGDAGDKTVVPFPSAADPSSEWTEARAVLRRLDRARARAWFDPLVREGRVGQVLELRAASSFHADYVMTHLIGDLTRAVAEADPDIQVVQVVS